MKQRNDSIVSICTERKIKLRTNGKGGYNVVQLNKHAQHRHASNNQPEPPQAA
jgi:hypothetical protein